MVLSVMVWRTGDGSAARLDDSITDKYYRDTNTCFLYETLVNGYLSKTSGVVESQRYTKQL